MNYWKTPINYLRFFIPKKRVWWEKWAKKGDVGVLMLGCSWEYLLVKRSGEVDCYNNNLKMYNTKGLNMREESFLVVSYNNINLCVV
jgi:hypothetical protein